MTFSNFSFDRRITAGIEACGYASPTPIQNQAIPLVLQGHDVMGLAQTGTGKTAAFALPILQRLLSQQTSARSPRVLVLAPTRELALQINENFNALAGKTSLRSGVVIGGVNMNPQIRAFRTAQVIIACPGRLVRLMEKDNVSLANIDTLVLDEADRMLDMGFMPDIKRIIAKLPRERQNLLFSATMPNDILTFARRILVNPKTVTISSTTPVASVDHRFYKTHDKAKVRLLEHLIGKSEHQSMLIFTRTKHKAKNLSRKLAGGGHATTFLQGNMSQNQRQRALDGFRDGSFTIMVATDIAARGIDCDRITHVVNFDMPDTVETYTHRIGRTGRAGRSGNAITLVTYNDNQQVRAIQRVMDVSVEDQSACGFDGGNITYEEVRTPRSKPAPKKTFSSRKRRPSRGRGAAA